MEDTMMATKVVFISKDRQQSMGMDDNECSVESRLAKIDGTHENIAQEDDSILTGSTRESKAKVYAVEAVNKISCQYNGTIEN